MKRVIRSQAGLDIPDEPLGIDPSTHTQ